PRRYTTHRAQAHPATTSGTPATMADRAGKHTTEAAGDHAPAGTPPTGASTPCHRLRNARTMASRAGKHAAGAAGAHHATREISRPAGTPPTPPEIIRPTGAHRHRASVPRHRLRNARTMAGGAGKPPQSPPPVHTTRPARSYAPQVHRPRRKHTPPPTPAQ
ncbi:MAG: hypothetical protein ACI4PY_02940, partial [Akkermansia muciniphila]